MYYSGFRNFHNVVEMVVRGLANIPKTRLLLMWSHIVLKAYEYLGYQRL